MVAAADAEASYLEKQMMDEEENQDPTYQRKK